MRRLLILLVLPLISCGQNRTLEEEVDRLYENTVPVLSVHALDSLMKNDSTIVVLDCREEEEYTVSHLLGAELAPYGSFDTQMISDKQKETTFVVYCSIGYRSERIGEQLLKAGYTNVYNLYGGIFQWKNEGMVVVDTSGRPTEQVHTYNRKWSRYLEVGEKIY